MLAMFVSIGVVLLGIGFVLMIALIPAAMALLVIKYVQAFREIYQHWQLRRSWDRHCREAGLDPDRCGGMADFPNY
jgi:hypothetical protein